MNYRHIYHAGNICDVVKHSVLTLMLNHLRQKDAAFCVLDTHAGTGLYDLQDPRALKTNEAADGLFKLLAAPPLPELADYFKILKKLNPASETIQYYPGSPLLIQKRLRPQDRLIACELHPEDFQALRHNLRFYHRQSQSHHRDGYEALNAFLPPQEKRGLVLIDPPFEQPNEFEKLADALIAAHHRWPQGLYMAWYPIKERPAIWRFHEKLATSGAPKILVAEFCFREETRHDQLNGSGLILINPPWQMDDKLRALFPALHHALGTPHRGSTVKYLTEETPS